MWSCWAVPLHPFGTAQSSSTPAYQVGYPEITDVIGFNLGTNQKARPPSSCVCMCVLLLNQPFSLEKPEVYHICIGTRRPVCAFLASKHSVHISHPLVGCQWTKGTPGVSQGSHPLRVIWDQLEWHSLPCCLSSPWILESSHFNGTCRR